MSASTQSGFRIVCSINVARSSSVFSMALLVFFSAAARTRIVTTNLLTNPYRFQLLRGLFQRFATLTVSVAVLLYLRAVLLLGLSVGASRFHAAHVGLRHG